MPAKAAIKRTAVLILGRMKNIWIPIFTNILTLANHSFQLNGQTQNLKLCSAI